MRNTVAFLIPLLALGQTLGEFKLARVLELKGETHHVQGVDWRGRSVWITSVDRPNSRGFLYEFALNTGEQLRRVEVGDGLRFHPGGFSLAGGSLWIPVAEYRPNSSSLIQRRSASTIEVQFQFEVPDHIACLAVTREFLIGGNWDSKEFYFWNHRGQLIRKVASTTGNAYQDIKAAGRWIVASGILADRTGAIDWLELPSLRLVRRLKAGTTDRGTVYTREGMAIHGHRLVLLPEDSPSRLFEFRGNFGEFLEFRGQATKPRNSTTLIPNPTLKEMEFRGFVASLVSG